MTHQTEIHQEPTTGHAIAFTHDKGGVGKSTSAANVAYRLAGSQFTNASGAKSRCRVLVVDLDPRGDVAQMLGGHPDPGVFEFFMSERMQLMDVVQDTGNDFLGILPGNSDTAMLNILFAARDTTTVQIVYRMEEMLKLYDVVIFDAPAAGGKLRDAALAMSGIIVIPVKPELYGINSIAPVLATLGRHQSAILLPTMVENNKVHATYIKQMAEWWPTHVIHLSDPGKETEILAIPFRAEALLAAEKGQTISQYNPRNKAAWAYNTLTQQLRIRMGQQYLF